MPADDTIAATGDHPVSEAEPIVAVNDPTDTAVDAPQTFSGTGSPWFWLGLLVVLGLTIRYIPAPSQAAVYIGTAIALTLHVLGVVNFAAHATRRPLSTQRWVAWFVLCLVLWAASQFLLRPFLLRTMMTQPAAREPFSIWSIIGAFNFTLRPLFLLGATVCGGSLVARLINSRNMLGPVCAIIALIDVWGVLFGGLVSQMLERAPAVAGAAMASLPAVGANTQAAQQFTIPQLQIGAGDYLFLGLLFAAVHRNNMNWRGALNWTVPLMILALLGVTLTGIHLPGLLFIGLGFAVPNWKYFEYTRDEWFALLYAGIFVIVLTVALYFGITSQLPEKPVRGHREPAATLTPSNQVAPPAHAAPAK